MMLLLLLLPESSWSLLLLCIAAQLWWWPGLGTSLEEMGTPPENLGVPLELGVSLHVPFEVTIGDKRFQAEATHWELSPPDSGHHQVVVDLCSRCTNWNEEEAAAKLVVALSNCRANIEGHQAHPSTPDMEQPSGRLWPVLENLSLLWPALEETLIAGRQHQMARLMEDITPRMGNVSGRGTVGLQEVHPINLSNSHHTQERARDVYSQLESSLALLLAQQQQMEEVMEKLWQMNQSLGLALVAVEGARNQVENHLQHLQHVQDPNSQRPSVISTCILHGSYFVLLVVLLVPTPPRAILLLLFLISSILAELLGISALLALLVLAVAGKWLFVATSCGAGGACLVVPPEKPRPWLTSTPEREHELELLQEELDKMEMSCLHEPSCPEQPPAMAGEVPNLAGQVSSICGASRTKLSYVEMLEVATGTEKHWEPKPYSPSRSLTSNMSLRSQCQGLTRVGQLCRKKAIPGQDFCYVHTTS